MMQTADMAKLTCMGSKWKELPAGEKQMYEDMAAEDKAPEGEGGAAGQMLW